MHAYMTTNEAIRILVLVQTQPSSHQNTDFKVICWFRPKLNHIRTQLLEIYFG